MSRASTIRFCAGLTVLIFLPAAAAKNAAAGDGRCGGAYTAARKAAAVSAPVALDDSYFINKNTTLAMPEPGVLANDTDVDGDTLSADLLTNPVHGSLTLNHNGRFIYEPDHNFAGTDSFAYRANDGNAVSNVATVSIYVNTTRTVTKTADTADGACNSDCSLREAIAAATPGDTIEFASPLFDTPQTILLSAANGFRDLIVDKNLTINGKGANLLTIEGPGSGVVKFRVLTLGDDVTVNLSGMKITNGYASNADGGGISAYGGVTNITNCYLAGNLAIGGIGGGIRNVAGGKLTIIGSTIYGNVSTDFRNAGGGTGIHNEGILTLINSTVSGNYKHGSGPGSGIWSSGTTTITNSTITGNQADNQNSAGGIYGNSSGTITVRNSIVASNGSASDVYGFEFISQGYNLIGNAGDINVFTTTGDQAGRPAAPLDPRLDPLADYGGTMPTHRLQSNSPAIDMGNSFGSNTDQRGSPRPADAATVTNLADGSDIGAFELQFAPTAALLSISGRVLTPDVVGLQNARVILTDRTGKTRTSLTGSFGYFRFADVAAGETYIVSVSSKRYVFRSQLATATQDMTNLTFRGTR